MSGDDTAAGEDPISELIGFLSDSRAEVRTAAATHVASLTGTVDGLSLLVKERERLLPPLLKLLHDADAKVLEQAYAALVNLSLDEDACKSLLSLGVVGRIMEILRGGHEKQGTVLTAKLLSNLTLRSEAVDELLQKGKGPLEGFFVSIIVQLLVSESGGAPEERDYFAAVLTNISQQGIGRKAFLGESAANLKLLNRELEKTASLVRQESLARVIRNVCMGSIEDGECGSRRVGKRPMLNEFGLRARVAHVPHVPPHRARVRTIARFVAAAATLC